MKFNWIKTFDNKEKDLVFFKNDEKYYPENLEDIKKYGILNIIDHHFDGNKPTPYDLDNNESASINSFFINAWDFFKDYLDSSEKNIKRLYCYYLSAIDCENFLYGLNRYKPRRCYLKKYDEEVFKEHLLELYNFYYSRNSFNDSDNFEFINDIDKKPNFTNGTYKVKIYLINNNNETLVELNDFDEYFKTYVKTDNLKSSEYYFEYVVENDFDIDSFGDVTNGISVFFELFDSIRKTCISYLGLNSEDENGNPDNFRKNFNYFEEYFKLYFYKILTEKYRTKNIEDTLLQELKYTDPGYEKIIEKIYAKMNGKNGNLGSPNMTVVSKETKFNGKFNSLKIPFYKSNFSKGGILSFYTEKRHLPKSFNIIKNYDSLKDFFNKISNEKIQQYYYDDISREELQEYFENNKADIINEKIKELIYSVKPSFNFIFDNYELKSKYEDKKTLIYKNSNKNFEVKEFNNSNAIEFGREFTGKKIRDYAKISIINPYIKDLENPEDIDLGSGYLNIQQFEPISKDNFVTNFNSSLFEFDKIRTRIIDQNRIKKEDLNNELTYDLNKIEDLRLLDDITIGHNNVDKIYKSFIIKTEKLEEIPENELENKKNNKISVHHRYEDFITALEDKEITIAHLSKVSLGFTKDLEKCTGYDKNGYIEIKKEIPEYRKTNVYIGEDDSYLLDVSNFAYYNNVESIKQIELIDYKSGRLFSFISEGIREQTYLDEYTCIEFENNNPYIDDSVLYNYVVDKIKNNSLELDSISSNSIKIKIPKSDLKTFTFGEMVVLGNDVDSSVSNIIENNNDYLLLNLNLKNGTVVENLRTITKKSIILKYNNNVKEYLDSLKQNEQRSVYISSFTQREGNADMYYISDIRLMNNDYVGEEFEIDVTVSMCGEEVNINRAKEITI